MRVEDLDLQTLQSKYKPDRAPIDLTTLIANNLDIYEEPQHLAAQENLREFQQEKLKDIQEEV
jgi:hypothetical protein